MADLNTFKVPATGHHKLGGQITIDSDVANDPGKALKYARNAYPKAGAHGTTAVAAANLNGGSRDKVIIGHGLSGGIVTGTGQLMNDKNRYISVKNVSVWQPLLSPLAGTVDTLIVNSCLTGSGSAGAALLGKLADVLQCTVYGATSNIGINAAGQVWLQSGGVWQTATPGHPPDPIEAPKPHDQMSNNNLTVYVDGVLRDYGWEQVRLVSFVAEPVDERNIEPFSVDGPGAVAVGPSMSISPPVELESPPLAVLTGHLTIALSDGTQKQFDVLADELLRDVSQEATYHYWNPAAPEIMRRAQERR